MPSHGLNRVGGLTAKQLLFSAVASVLCIGQQNAAPKFTAHAELVTVPVVVTRAGQFVSGLKAADFTVFEDGKAQVPARFEEVQMTSATVPPSLPNERYSNQFFRPADRPPITIIVLDRARTPVPEFSNAVNEIKKFVSRYLQPGTPTMLAEVDDHGLRVLQNFTASPQSILDALGRVSPIIQLHGGTMDGTSVQLSENATQGVSGAAPSSKPPQLVPNIPDFTDADSGPSIANAVDISKENIDPNAPTGNIEMDLLHGAIIRAQQNTTIATLVAMEQIARSVSGIPGRKALIWTSPGYVCPFFGSMRDMKGKQVAIGEQCETIWRLLNAANVSVYPVVPTQTENPTFSSGRCTGPCGGTSTIQLQLTLLSYAQYTGGKVCSYRNDLDECYHRALEDSLRYYELSYYAARTDKPVWRRIEVKVNSPHAAVRSRRWYLATPSNAATSESEMTQALAAAVVSPVDYTAIPIAVRWTGITQRDGKDRASFEIHISPETLTFDENDGNRLDIEIVAIEMDGANRVTNIFRQTVRRQIPSAGISIIKTAGLTYTNAMTVATSAVRVKFAVRDVRSGRIGTVNATIRR